MERPVSFYSDGLRLFGILGFPSQGAMGTGTVLVHGWGGYRIGPNRILVEAARTLNEAGVATLRFDLRGRGDSEGKAEQADLDAMIDDTRRAVAYLKQEAGIERIALLGICSGANVAVGAATLLPDVDCLVLWSAFAFQQGKKPLDRVRRSGHLAAEYAHKMLRPTTWRRLLAGRVNVRLIGKAIFGKSLADSEPGRNLKASRRDIMAAFAGCGARVLFIHGSKDPEGMPARAIFRNFCAENGVRADFRLVEGASHNFASTAWKREVIDTTVAWLLQVQSAERTE